MIRRNETRRKDEYPFTDKYAGELATLLCARPSLFSRLGDAIDPEAVRLEPARLALQAAKAIAAEIGNGPSSLTAVLQRLRLWQHEGRVKKEQIEDVNEMFDIAFDSSPNEDAIAHEAIKILKRWLYNEALQTGFTEYANKADLTQARKLMERADRLGANAATARGRGSGSIIWRTASEVSRSVPHGVPWLASPWLVKGGLTELDGKIKVGKTVFALRLVRAVLRGEEFLGRAAVKSAVVYLNEAPTASFIEAMRKAGVAESEDLHVVQWHDVMGTPWPDIVESAVATAGKVGAKVLVVDTLSQWANLSGDDENGSGPALNAMKPLQAAAATGLAVLILRHERKAGGEVGDSARGSSAFGGAVDIIVSIRRPEGQSARTRRVLKSTSRYEETPSSLVIELKEDGYVTLGSEGDVAQSALDAAVLAAAPTIEEDAASLVEFVESLGAGYARTSVQNAIRRLVESNRLNKTGSGKKGDPKRFWVAPDSAGTLAPVPAAEPDASSAPPSEL